jgi:hypothetical protein
VAASISPIEVEWGEIAVSIVFGLAAVATVLPVFGDVLGRRRGVLLVGLYAGSVATLLLTQG